MDALGVYYAGAIRDNIGDVDAMEKAIWAVLDHSPSTDEDPQHQFCPVGEESWCKYQRAIALSQDIPPANRIPPDLVQFIRPVFEELTDRETLDRCILGATQNQNESCNNLIWERCCKTDSCSVLTVQLAVDTAAMVFNNGMTSIPTLIRHLGGESESLGFFDNCGADRVRKAERESEIVTRRRRLARPQTRKETEECNIVAEGLKYSLAEEKAFLAEPRNVVHSFFIVQNYYIDSELLQTTR